MTMAHQQAENLPRLANQYTEIISVQESGRYWSDPNESNSTAFVNNDVRFLHAA